MKTSDKGGKKVLTLDQIPLPTLRRLPYYHNILCQMEEKSFTFVSSKMISEQLGIDDTQVRKDIAYTGYVGKPKVGFNTTEFKEHLENFLGMNESKEAFLIGMGNLGIALSKYEGFKSYGLNIIGLFDSDPNKIKMKVGDLEVYPIEKLEAKMKKEQVQLAILALPASAAQPIADILIKQGIKAIWNFAPVHLDVPKEVFVWNENLAASFISLSQYIAKCNK